MTDDPIKAALVAATEELCSEDAGFRCKRLCGECSRRAPKVVAAFLRALPNVDFGEDRAGGWSSVAGCTDLHDIADAVARAAQEARDDR